MNIKIAYDLILLQRDISIMESALICPPNDATKNDLESIRLQLFKSKK